MLLEALERDALAERQVAAVLIAAGRIEGTDLPNVQSARDRFEALLADDAKKAPADSEEAELRRALGLPGG